MSPLAMLNPASPNPMKPTANSLLTKLLKHQASRKHKDTTQRGRNQICRIGSGEGIPLLGEEGWTRHQEDAAKPPLKARPGWSVRRKRRRAGLTTPSAPLRWLRVFFLNGAATPPVPGGEYPRLTILADFRKRCQKNKAFIRLRRRTARRVRPAWRAARTYPVRGRRL